MDKPYLDLVDPELRDIAMHMRGIYDGLAPMTLEKLGARRQAVNQLLGAPARPDVPVQERVIPGLSGHPDVTIFIVNAKADGSGGILHLHGGGFNASSARGGLSGLQQMAAELDCVAVTVEYRLAPETPFPGALMDNAATLAWLHAHGPSIGLDPSRIVLLGESAGGGHAAMLSLHARDEGRYKIAFQALIYPMLDDRTGSTRPTPPHIGAFGWNADANRFGWRCLLGQEPGTEQVPAAAVPARRTDLAGLPPTFIGVGGLDLFVQEDIDFARRLIEARVPTELLVMSGAIHGFDVLASESAVARRFNSAKLAVLRQALSG